MENNEEREITYLCKNCIDAIRSRGEKVFVGKLVDPYEFNEERGYEPEDETEMICDWCEEPSWELYECVF